MISACMHRKGYCTLLFYVFVFVCACVCVCLRATMFYAAIATQ